MADFTYDNGKSDAVVIRFIDDVVYITGAANEDRAGFDYVLTRSELKQVVKAYKGYKKAMKS